MEKVLVKALGAELFVFGVTMIIYGIGFLKDV